ncbi:MAG: amylo-alpha-1,6-glucosidase, partial [Candidatus Diapherotrites archaeon]
KLAEKKLPKEKKLTEKQLKKEIGKTEKESKKIDELISCNYKELEKGFIDSAKGIGLLENNENFFAGYPWFLQYWGRDNLWSLSSLISLREFETAEKVLEYFWKNNQNGKIPNFIEREKITFNSIDASLLFLIGLQNYVFASGNKKILKKIDYWKVLKFLRTQEKDGLIYHQGNATWMDSISRTGAGIEIQALYLKALHSVRNLLVLEKELKEVHEIEKKAVELNRKIIQKFERNSIFADLINERNELVKTCNPLVYLMQKKATEKEIELFESQEFNCAKGILTRSFNEKSFNSEGYHTGLSWSLCTGWMACAEFKAERKEKGIKYLMKLVEDLNSDCVGGIGECWNLNGKLKGCGTQLWGHSFVIKAIDEFMLGIKLNAFEKTIYLKPQLLEKINYLKRKMRLGNTLFDLTVERKKGKISAKISDKKIKVEFY